MQDQTVELLHGPKPKHQEPLPQHWLRKYQSYSFTYLLIHSKSWIPSWIIVNWIFRGLLHISFGFYQLTWESSPRPKRGANNQILEDKIYHRGSDECCVLIKLDSNLQAHFIDKYKKYKRKIKKYKYKCWSGLAQVCQPTYPKPTQWQFGIDCFLRRFVSLILGSFLGFF